MDLQHCWPVTIDLFATVLNYHLPVYFLLLNDPMAAGTDAFLHQWDHLQACAFPPFSLICQVLSKLQSSQGTLLTLMALSGLRRSGIRTFCVCRGSSCCPAFMSQSAQTAPCPSSAPEPPYATASYVETVECFVRHLGLSRRVARQLSLCLRPSSRKLYQHRWEVYRCWFADRGHSVSSLSIAKVIDFLLFLQKDRHLSVPSIRGFRSPLSFLRGSSFELLSSCSLRQLTLKVLFLLSLATAKRVGKLQALSHCVAFRGSDLSLSCLPEFVAKTESVRNPLPRSFLVKSLEGFLEGMPEERSLCPVHAVRIYLEHTSSLSPHLRSLFVSPSNSSRPLSKNALYFFLWRVILDAVAVADYSMSCTHSVRGVATSAAFLRNRSVSKVLEAASWRSNPVFA